MEPLTLEDIHYILLDIAKEFDRICTKYNIPYYMIGGTMLGAIRHNGFIPWDDDMDFGVPVEYYYEMQEILEKELPSKFRCCTYKTSNSIYLPFLKIEDITTILDDKQNPLSLEEKIGINIDIFPLYRTNRSDTFIGMSRNMIEIGAKIYTNSRSQSILISRIKQLLRFICPLNLKWFIEKSIYFASKIEHGPYLSNIWGRWGEREFIPFDWYGEWVRYNFEGLYLCGIKEYDAYLCQMYNTYMELPQKTNQFTHSNLAYKK